MKLLVGNIGPGCGEGGADGFDFLLNYLTLKGGIPRRLRNLPPQLVPGPFAEWIGKAIERLGHIHAPDNVVLPEYDAILHSDTLSCSNTQYP